MHAFLNEEKKQKVLQVTSYMHLSSCGQKLGKFMCQFKHSFEKEHQLPLEF